MQEGFEGNGRTSSLNGIDEMASFRVLEAEVGEGFEGLLGELGRGRELRLTVG